MPYLIGRSRRLVLHASAVAAKGRVIGFVGRSGMGKSTICASLVRGGAQLICDDCLVLDRLGDAHIATPSYPGVRMWQDTAKSLAIRYKKDASVAHYTQKVRLSDARTLRFSRAPKKLSRLIILGKALRGARALPVLRPLPHQEAFAQLLSHVFRLRPDDKASMRGEFLELSHLLRTCPVHRLDYPRRLSALNRVRKLILTPLALKSAKRRLAAK